MKKIFWVAVVAAFFSNFSVSAQTVDDEYRSLVKEYLQLTNTEKTIELIVPQMLEASKRMAPDVPEEWWQKMELKIKEKFKSEQIAAGIADVYVKYLNKQELKDVVAFYKTPSGKKIAENTPAISQDCMKWGQSLGMEIVMEIVKELKEDGFKVNM